MRDPSTFQPSVRPPCTKAKKPNLPPQDGSVSLYLLKWTGRRDSRRPFLMDAVQLAGLSVLKIPSSDIRVQMTDEYTGCANQKSSEKCKNY
jgi:hypothetical protein